MIERIEAGAKASDEAKTSVASIESTITGVSQLVEEVDQQNDQITRATGMMTEHVDRVSAVLDSYDRAANENEQRLETAHERIEELELTASEMFDRIVQAGLSPQDSAMVETAQRHARQVEELAEKAISEGRLSFDQLFDQNYVEIQGSNPKRYRTGLMDWAHDNWRHVLDSAAEGDSRVMAAACTDMKGYLPTHLTRCSKTPTGDLEHDTQFVRNGRILLDTIDQRAKESRAPYMMAVYRQENDGKTYRVVRNVYVPVTINGRRWGDFELAYSFG